MVLDTIRRSRRGLFSAALGGATAAAASSIARPSLSQAASNGQALILGTTNSCSTQGTTISNLVSADADFAHGKTGVWGASPSQDGFGIQGYASGTSGTGVHGFTSGHYSQVAVDADTLGGNGEGTAVRARTKNGTALLGSAIGGYALHAIGTAVFSRSGRAVVPQGSSSCTVSGQAFTADSLILATIQGSVAGTWVRGVALNRNASTFIIRLNRKAPVALTVGWFIVN